MAVSIIPQFHNRKLTLSWVTDYGKIHGGSDNKALLWYNISYER